MEPDKLRSFLVEQLARGRGSSVETTSQELLDNPVIDSYEGVEIAIAAEEKFGISLSDDEVSEPYMSLDDLVRLINSKLQTE